MMASLTHSCTSQPSSARACRLSMKATGSSSSSRSTAAANMRRGTFSRKATEATGSFKGAKSRWRKLRRLFSFLHGAVVEAVEVGFQLMGRGRVDVHHVTSGIVSVADVGGHSRGQRHVSGFIIGAHEGRRQIVI